MTLIVSVSGQISQSDFCQLCTCATDTLLTWKKVIMDGPNKLSLHLEELYNEINNSILNVLENNVEELKKNDIADNLPYSSSLVNTVINNMRDSGMILYDNHKKRWVAV